MTCCYDEPGIITDEEIYCDFFDILVKEEYVFDELIHIYKRILNIDIKRYLYTSDGMGIYKFVKIMNNLSINSQYKELEQLINAFINKFDKILTEFTLAKKKNFIEVFYLVMKIIYYIIFIFYLDE